jgi:Ceramidase
MISSSPIRIPVKENFSNSFSNRLLDHEGLKQKMNLFTPVDYYCERTNSDFWNEPLNLWSNLSFIIAGILILKVISSKPKRPVKPGSKLLGWLLIIVGIGSGLFHSFANVLTMWADVIPIGLFVLTYLWLFLRHIAKVSSRTSVLFMTGFVLLTILVARLSDHSTSNGGETYFGTWISLFGIFCYYCGLRISTQTTRAGLGLILFSSSIFFRTIDLTYCDQWPYGTHIFWHIFNACAIYQMIRSYIDSDLEHHEVLIQKG